MNTGHGYGPPHEQLFMSIVPGHHTMLQPPPNMVHPVLPGLPAHAMSLDPHAHLVPPHPGGLPAQHTTLAQHGAILHPHGGAPIRTCPIPGCDFVTNQGRARMEKHVATHGTEKPFKCQVEGCGKGFKLAEHLRQHARVHATERMFRCTRPLCEEHDAFKSMPELRLHETRVHTLDKAEGREMKLKERLAKMERDAESARKDNATLRKAVELLQTTLKEATAPRRPRKRKSGGNGNGKDGGGGDDDGDQDEGGGGEGGDGSSRERRRQGDASTSMDAGGGMDDDGRKRVRKAYTVSASNILIAAKAAAAVALAGAEERWDKGKANTKAGSRKDGGFGTATPSVSTATAKGTTKVKGAGAVKKKLPRGEVAPLMRVTAAGVGVGGEGVGRGDDVGGSTRNTRNAAAGKE